MNFFGLNRAAFDGSAIRAIAGASLVSALANVSAAPTNTQSASPLTITTVAVLQATPTDIQAGACAISAAAAITAQWELLTLVSANVLAGATIKATNTESSIQTAATLTATATQIQNGAAYIITAATVSAVPLDTIGYSSTVYAQATVTADASYTPSGSSFTYRDGYVNPIVTMATVTVNGALRTALASANVATLASGSATATWVQGGSAQCNCLLSVTAQPSSAASAINAAATVTANGYMIGAGVSSLAIAANVSATWSCLTQGNVTPVMTAAAVTSSGLLAQQSSAWIGCAATVGVAERLAIKGASVCLDNAALTAIPTNTQAGSASINAAISASFSPLIAQYGAANIMCAASIRAAGYSHEDILAPAERTIKLQADSRVIVLKADDRTLTIL